MPNRSREKGDRLERLIVNLLKAAGFAANRVPMSGSIGGDYSDDVKLTWFDGEVGRWECKSRATGFAQIYNWLGECRGLFIKADRKPTLVVMRLEDWLDLMGRAHGKK